jgi:uncharacterized protein (TIGR03086 family)
MSTPIDAVVVLGRALDQLGDVLTRVHPDQLDRPTPCADWDVRQLIGHVLATPGRFLEMSRGGQPDWSSDPEPPKTGWAQRFRSDADDLVHFWHQRGEEADPGQLDWQTADMAVHTWDLARATGQRTDRLDPEVAERGLAFMKQGLTPDNRHPAFGPEVPVADDAPPYDRLAAWAGRDPAS